MYRWFETMALVYQVFEFILQSIAVKRLELPFQDKYDGNLVEMGSHLRSATLDMIFRLKGVRTHEYGLEGFLVGAIDKKSTFVEDLLDNGCKLSDVILLSFLCCRFNAPNRALLCVANGKGSLVGYHLDKAYLGSVVLLVSHSDGGPLLVKDVFGLVTLQLQENGVVINVLSLVAVRQLHFRTLGTAHRCGAVGSSVDAFGHGYLFQVTTVIVHVTLAETNSDWNVTIRMLCICHYSYVMYFGQEPDVGYSVG